MLVEMDGIQSILASTSLALEPLSVIRLYSYRFRIECTFRELKQQVGAFCYHFWSKHMPKLSYYQKKDEPSPLERVGNEKSRRKVLETVRAIEMHMALSCIAMGILQSVSIRFAGEFHPGQIRYQRTPSRGGCQKPLSCTICGNIFPPFRKTARIMHNADNSGTAG